MWAYNYDYSDYLMHYGVKGMRWGVRHVDRALARALGKKTSEVSSKELSKLRNDVNQNAKRYIKAYKTKNKQTIRDYNSDFVNRNAKNKKYGKLVKSITVAENTKANDYLDRTRKIPMGVLPGLAVSTIAYNVGKKKIRDTARADYDSYGKKIKKKK